MCIALTLCPGLTLESKSPIPHSISLQSLSIALSLSVPPSLSHHFTLLHFLSNHLARTLTVVILDVISQPGYQSKFLPNISLGLLIPYQIYKWCSRQKSSLHLATFHLGLPTPLLPLLALNINPLTPHMYCRLCGPIFDSEINTFSTRFTRAIEQELPYLKQTPHGLSCLVDLLG